MEVDRISFYPLLLDILTDISEAHFVAFDLEMSGVPTKKPNSERGPGRPTLQDRYHEVKEVSCGNVATPSSISVLREIAPLESLLILDCGEINTQSELC